MPRVKKSDSDKILDLLQSNDLTKEELKVIKHAVEWRMEWLKKLGGNLAIKTPQHIASQVLVGGPPEHHRQSAGCDDEQTKPGLKSFDGSVDLDNPEPFRAREIVDGKPLDEPRDRAPAAFRNHAKGS